MINIYPEDCIDKEKKIPDQSVNLLICDPPFGIGEASFNKHYKRDKSHVIEGYQEAPEDYESWTLAWMTEAKRVLKENGSMYVFIGYSNLKHILNVADTLELYELNHLIWKYNFGVYTKKKYVTSHYHILYYSLSEKAKPTFNANCRFGQQEKDDDDNGSLLYQDLEDVFYITRDYSPKKMKNQNKLPDALIQKLLLYSSNEGDMVGDFFMGNFTTAYNALKLGRHVCGYEINKNAYDYHMPLLESVEFGCDLLQLKQVNNMIPFNQGKTITQEEIQSICCDYFKMEGKKMKKGEINLKLQEKYGRGKFAIKNILDKHLDQARRDYVNSLMLKFNE